MGSRREWSLNFIWLEGDLSCIRLRHQGVFYGNISSKSSKISSNFPKFSKFLIFPKKGQKGLKMTETVEKGLKMPTNAEPNLTVWQAPTMTKKSTNRENSQNYRKTTGLPVIDLQFVFVKRPLILQHTQQYAHAVSNACYKCCTHKWFPCPLKKYS